jgi:hypothetical protein
MSTTFRNYKYQVLRLFLDLKPDEIKAFKIMCLRQDTTMREWTESVVREHIRRMDQSPILKYPPPKPLVPAHGSNGRFTGKLVPKKKKTATKKL